ncbi:ATP-binding protein [Thermomonospora sp. CIF 1]|uniref:sensor histidine kinase n=1 Tax=Thermomonospora sp. CIF 1 TaxID=1916083 RepID=UPI000ACFD988|nr:ATP-binding protein [Thermomonospora sp. CIF 1]PKK15502.1 MAG: sensor histidine kinase [Thermomonospora sp. CIF 1]
MTAAPRPAELPEPVVSAGSMSASSPLPPQLAPLRPPTQLRGLSRIRLGQWFYTTAAALTVLMAITVTLAVLALQGYNQARAILIDQIDPAALRQFQLTTAMEEQDSAIRAYARHGREADLKAYKDAVTAERQAAAAMTRQLAAVPGAEETRRRVDAAVAAIAVWRERFAGPLAEGAQLTRDSNETGRMLFRQVNAANSATQRELTRLHGTYDQQLRDRARTLYLWLALTGVVFVVGSTAITLLIRWAVLRPVNRLSEQVRAIAQGDFAHPLRGSGPADFVELADIVDSMRHRIVQEWRAASEARQMVAAQAAELRRSNAELEQFAYVASHDLQEPLRKVASFCQMLERRYGDRLDERGRRYIDFAVDGAKRMQALISDLLMLSRVGRSERKVEPVDMGALLERTKHDLGHPIEESGAEVTADPLPTVTGDRTLLAVLLQNLVGNAIKFRGEDPPRVHLSAEPSADDPGMWEFACRDNGIGIDPKYAERIFMIFQRLHPQDTYSGTGIGLAMCRKIVEFHGGRIWLDPGHEGPGTTFRWTLPVRQADTEERADTESEEGDDAADG